jgi:hypothetical protein
MLRTANVDAGLVATGVLSPKRRIKKGRGGGWFPIVRGREKVRAVQSTTKSRRSIWQEPLF